MTINSPSFLLFLLAALVLFHLAPGSWRARIVFPLTSLVFMGLVMPSWIGFGIVLGFAVLIWLSTRILARSPAQGIMVAVVAVVLLIFGWLKEYTFLAFLPFSALIPSTVGLSYMLIRGMQLLADVREDPALRPQAITVFSFLTGWPCLISGPVQRFQDFAVQLHEMAAFRLTDKVVLASLSRMVRGWFWVLVLGGISKFIWLGLKSIAFQAATPLALGGAELFFLVHLFFDFAGYTEIVIGVGGLFGLQLPENFNRPFEARSFLDFWSRWHMSMSNWFKVYAFNPLLMAFTQRWPSTGAANIIGAAAFFITFFLVGLWHGTTGAFIVCGLLLGLGASVNQWYRAFQRKRLGKKRFDALGTHRLHIILSVGVTFAYLCLSITPLWMSLTDMQRILAGHGVVGLLVAHLLVAVLAMLLFSWKWPALPLPRGQVWSCFVIALQIVLIEIYLFLFPSFGGAFFYEQF